MRCIAIALVCQGMSRCRWQRSPVRRHPTAVPRSAAAQCRQPPENHGSALGVVVVLTISAVGHPDAGEGRRLREQGRRTGGGVLFSSSVGSRSALANRSRYRGAGLRRTSRVDGAWAWRAERLMRHSTQLQLVLNEGGERASKRLLNVEPIPQDPTIKALELT